MKGQAILLTCAVGAALLWNLSQSHVPEQAGLAVLLTGLALVLDWTAARLPGAGFVSCSFVATLTMALQPGIGAGWACLVAAVSLSLRGILRPGHVTSQLSYWSVLVELVPQVAALTALGGTPVSLTRALGAGALYLAISLTLPGWLAVQLPADLRARLVTIQGRLTAARLACCLQGVVLGYLLNSQPGYALALAPTLWQLWQSIDVNLRLEEQDQRRDVALQLSRSHSELEKASQKQNLLHDSLARKQDEYRVLEEASQSLLLVENRQQTATKILQICTQLCLSESIVIFLRENGALAPAAGQTPYAERLKGASLLGLHENMVEAALRTGQIQRTPQGPLDSRVFVGERAALALPLGSVGVVYLGRAQVDFSELEIRHLEQAVSLGGLGMQIATHLEELRRALEQERLLSHQLQQWSQALDGLLHFSLQFLDQLDVRNLQATLEVAVATLFGAESSEVCLAGRHESPACQAVLESKTPLLIDDISTTRFPPHRPGQRSFLCVPIFHNNLSQVGLIVLGNPAVGAFTRQQRDFLSLFSNLAAVAWKNAELHAETLAAQSQLVQSSKMAAVGQLAAGIAHELNTPLGSIALSVDMARKLATRDPEMAMDRLDKAKEGVERSRIIVEKLLYYSRAAQSGRVPSPIAQLLKDAIELMAHPLSLEGVKVHMESPPDLRVEVNQNEIQQVIFNLLLNANDAVVGLPEDRKIIEVRTSLEGHQVVVTVTDQGSGIPADVQPRIFEPFFTTKPVGQGTGLGLSVSQQIVSNHGGQLTFRSQPGQTEFALRLPHCVI